VSETSVDGIRSTAGEPSSLTDAIQALDERVREALGRMERIEQCLSPTRGEVEVLSGRLRDAADDLDVCQAECIRLTDEIVPLRSEYARILAELNETRLALEEARATILVMESTRGWKLLVRLRHLRDRMSGRG